jgi:hypothetical protein
MLPEKLSRLPLNPVWPSDITNWTPFNLVPVALPSLSATFAQDLTISIYSNTPNSEQCFVHISTAGSDLEVACIHEQVTYFLIDWYLQDSWIFSSSLFEFRETSEAEMFSRPDFETISLTALSILPEDMIQLWQSSETSLPENA